MGDRRRRRGARGLDDAVNELRLCAGSQFDPAVIDALVELLRELETEGPSEEDLKRAS